MANDLSSFAKSMESIADRIAANAIEIQKDVAMEVLSQVIIATPIDTGRAKSNWHANSGTPITSVRDEAYFPGEGGSTEDQNTELAIAVGDAAIKAHRGGPVWISNNLDYMKSLNEGSSKQAPKLFVETAVLNASRTAIKRSLLASIPNAREK